MEKKEAGLTANEPIQSAAQDFVYRNKRLIVYGFFGVLALYLAYLVKELTTLLFAAYFVSLLLDPLVSHLAKYKLSRGTAVLILTVSFVLIGFVFLLVAVPIFVKEYGVVSRKLIQIFETESPHIIAKLESLIGAELSKEFLMTRIKDLFSALSAKELSSVAGTVSETVLKGYSITIGALNLILFPFFVFYICQDLPQIHKRIYIALPENIRDSILSPLQEILDHIYSFFRGQITVALVMAVLYILGLMLVGFKHSILVGVVAGCLNIVPYLGLFLGALLAILMSVATDPGWLPLLKVAVVFVAVQGIESMVLTPKILGDSVGIHPLVVIVVLVVGAQLFGLLGMILAIPGAAAFGVLYRYLVRQAQTEH